ncbi:Uncharacterised protein [Neisseria subflava]|uniref:Uncharacterized protein n=1 Tax=Neisseria subflava TaxID=28449 RepID=A0A9X9QY37_NEISU|nr:Uncharacterised protein [Neisseria subflava]
MSTFFQQTAQAMIAKHIDRLPKVKQHRCFLRLRLSWR